MIEIKNNEIIIKNIDPLLSNPVESIFESLKKIWNATNSDLGYYYQNNERLSSNFEKKIFELHPEIYDVIIRESNQNTTIFDLLSKEKFCLVIMDGLSIREVSLLLEILPEEVDYKYLFSYSVIPSETEFFTQKYFNSVNPSKMRSNELFNYYHLIREEMITHISQSEDKLIIWSIFPDKRFHEHTIGFETSDLQKIGKETKLLFKKLFHHLRNKHIVLTSDHGYLIDSFSWKGIRDFPGTTRYSKEIPNYLKKYCKFVNEYWILIGRYNRIKRGRYVHVRHGGLSFLEIIVPFIEIYKD